MTRVAIRPELLRWARERAGIVDTNELLAVPKIEIFSNWGRKARVMG
jgi:hypothetical protein